MFKKVLFVFIFIALIILVDIYFEINFYKINSVNLNTNKLPSGKQFTIIQITDIHDKRLLNLDSLITSVKNTSPDVIVITGDILSPNTQNLDNIKSIVEKIAQLKIKTYFVSGNHDVANIHYKQLISLLSDNNFKIIDNNNEKIIKDNFSIYISGVGEYYTRSYDLKAAFNGVAEKDYNVLLSHSPDIVNKFISVPDLTLSGHTHGGQVRLPFIGAIVAPGQGLFPKYDKGIFELQKEKYLYIDSGLGTSVHPIRFLNRSQFSVINIVGK